MLVTVMLDQFDEIEITREPLRDGGTYIQALLGDVYLEFWDEADAVRLADAIYRFLGLTPPAPATATSGPTPAPGS